MPSDPEVHRGASAVESGRAATTVPVIELRNVEKWFGADSYALRGVSLSVTKGEVVVILGPSGSGKSTLLRSINLLEVIDRGEILINGAVIWDASSAGRKGRLPERKLARHRCLTAMVFQQFGLFAHKTALENVYLSPVHVNREDVTVAKTEARELLKMVGLERFAERYPSELSGGQQQRVAIARCLAMKPAAMLFDEPTSALDPEMVGEVLKVIAGLREQEMTMVLVTHEIGFARAAADRIVFMDEGLIVEEGTPAEFFGNPRTDRARRFLENIMH